MKDLVSLLIMISYGEKYFTIILLSEYGHAIACIKYPQIKHDETKFDGQVNIDYPCKLWSSLT